MRRGVGIIAAGALALLAVGGTARGALTDAQRCESMKDAAGGKFAQCRLRADATYAKTGDLTRRNDAYTTCAQKLSDAYSKAEWNYPGACPTAGDKASVASFLQTCTEKTRDWTAGDLASPLVFERLAASGQTTCWKGGNDSTDPSPAACAGTGQDGEYTAGATLAYVDNGDGTITDSNGRLQWEKKSDNGTLHDKDNTYPWVAYCSGDNTTWCTRDADCSGAGGTCSYFPWGGSATVYQWIDQVNAANFAGHSDWRIPNIRELAGLANYEYFYPAPSISAEFNANCGTNSSGNPGCTVTTCSCTIPSGYWSSSTVGYYPQLAWFVYFDYGYVDDNYKTNFYYVRAVRGGS